MKKILLSSLFTASVLLCCAQVAMEPHMPAFGTLYSLNSIAGGTITTSPATGANITWDYSNVTPNAIINYKVVDPNTVPSSIRDSVPDADFGVQQQGAPNPELAGYDFYTNKTTHLIHSGMKPSGSGKCQKLTDTIVMFNQSYQSTQHYYGFDRTYAGYGTLKVGNKTYNNIVLIKSVSPGNTSDTSFQFHRFTPAYGLILSFNNGPNGVKNIIYFGWDPNGGGNGMEEDIVIQGSLNIYPNPAKDWVTIHLSETETGELSLYNYRGQLVKTETLQKGTNAHTFSIEGLSPGIYSLHFGSRRQKLLIE